MSNDESHELRKVDPSPLPAWAKAGLWLLFIVGGVLLFMALRRGGPGALATVAAPAVGGACSHAPAKAPIDTTCLGTHLLELAEHESLIPPAGLYQALRQRGVPLKSSQHMARELRKLGLSSEIRTVSGRPERRWYDLSALASNE